MKIFFSVGEPSGDLHGANLIQQLRQRSPDLELVGYGGPRMEAAGCQLHEELTRLAIMGITRAVWNIRTFWKLVWQADEFFREQRPDAVVLIDYPGFNWWIAWRAKHHGIPVFYYGVPQLWAWASWRVKKMRRYVDHVLVKLPFEVQWYQERGCENVHYVGHPFFDETAARKLDQSFLESVADPRPLVAILPGSRTQEVINNLPAFLKAAVEIQKQQPDTRFAIASFNEKQAEMARQQLAEIDLPAEIYVGRTPELIEAAHCCMACSGSVSLELLAHRKPTVILYHVGGLLFFLQKCLLKVRFITLVNLLAVVDPLRARTESYDPDAAGAEQVPFPEYLTKHDKSNQLAAQIVKLLTDDQLYSHRVQWLTELQQKYGAAGASARGAEYIAKQLGLGEVVARQVA